MSLTFRIELCELNELGEQGDHCDHCERSEPDEHGKTKPWPWCQERVQESQG